MTTTEARGDRDEKSLSDKFTGLSNEVTQLKNLILRSTTEKPMAPPHRDDSGLSRSVQQAISQAVESGVHATLDASILAAGQRSSTSPRRAHATPSSQALLRRAERARGSPEARRARDSIHEGQQSHHDATVYLREQEVHEARLRRRHSAQAATGEWGGYSGASPAIPRRYDDTTRYTVGGNTDARSRPRGVMSRTRVHGAGFGAADSTIALTPQPLPRGGGSPGQRPIIVPRQPHLSPERSPYVRNAVHDTRAEDEFLSLLQDGQ